MQQDERKTLVHEAYMALLSPDTQRAPLPTDLNACHAEVAQLDRWLAACQLQDSIFRHGVDDPTTVCVRRRREQVLEVIAKADAAATAAREQRRDELAVESVGLDREAVKWAKLAFWASAAAIALAIIQLVLQARAQ